MFKFRCSNCGTNIENTADMNGTPCPKCGQPIGAKEAGSRLAPGTHIGGFEIVRLIGSGGTGNVYQATQLSMGRSVALKVLYPELTENKETVRQFFDEIRVLGQIQHPNIVCAFESGSENGLYFLAMQLVNGLSLDEHLSENGTLPVESALDITARVAAALKSVWDKYRLCHRDIKPGNIMLDEDGTPMLLDFGATLRFGDESIKNGQVEGSPYYMSPEQSRGEKLDFSSDLYSLGATLYHLLVGVPPYDNPDLSIILQMHCTEPFPLPSQRNPESMVPAEVVVLMKKMMAKTPAERFESWDALLQEIKKVRAELKKKKTKPAAQGTKPAAAQNKSGKTRSAMLDDLAAAQKKSSSGKVISTIGYLLVTCAAAAVLCFILGNRNTKSAENLRRAAEISCRNILIRGGDTNAAIAMYQKAVDATKEFMVKKETAEKIRKEADENCAVLRLIPGESEQTRQYHEMMQSVLENAKEARRKAEERLDIENAEALKKHLLLLKELHKRMEEFHPHVDTDRKTMESDMRRLQNEIAKIEELLDDAPVLRSSRPRYTPPAAKTKSSVRRPPVSPRNGNKSSPSKPARGKDESSPLSAAAEKDSQSETESENTDNAEKQRKNERNNARKILKNTKANISGNLISLIRKQDWNGVEQLLQMPEIKNDDPELQADKQELQEWIRILSRKYETAAPLMKQLPAGLSSNEEKKIRLYALAGNNRDLLYPVMLLNGYFAEAEKIMPEKDEALAEELAKGFLEKTIRTAIQTSRGGDSSMLFQLRKEYEGSDIFRRLENEISDSLKKQREQKGR